MEVQLDPLSGASRLNPPPPSEATEPPFGSDANARLEPIDEAAIKQEMLSFFVDASQPARPHPNWSFTEPSDGIRRWKIEPCELDFRFKRQFTESQIFAAERVAGRSISGMLPLLFGNADRMFLVVKDDTKLVDVCTDNVLPLFGELPALTAALRGVDGKSKTEAVPLVLVETLRDMQVLRALGFHAELSFGLQSLSAASIEQLFAPDNTDEPWQHHLLIAGWNISGLSLTNRPGALAIAKRLSRMNGLYGHDPNRRFSYWQPSVRTRGAIKNAYDFRDVELIRKLMKSSFPKQQLGKDWRYHLEPAPVTYHEARMQLKELLTQSTELPLVSKVKTALAEYRRVAHDQVTAPLYAKAERAESPMVRSMIHQAIELQERVVRDATYCAGSRKGDRGRSPRH